MGPVSGGASGERPRLDERAGRNGALGSWNGMSRNHVGGDCWEGDENSGQDRVERRLSRVLT
jgi:hypothetical protein